MNEHPVPLKIALLTWSARQSNEYLTQLAVDNAEQLKRVDLYRYRLILKDGTTIFGVHPGTFTEGLRIDQIIVATDCGPYPLVLHPVFKKLLYHCRCTCVPEDFRVQFYHLGREASYCEGCEAHDCEVCSGHRALKYDQR